MRNFFKQISGASIVFVISLCINRVSAQSSGKVEIYAPNTWAFAKYGDVPVEPSTGIPNINIPLMSLTDKDINLDFSLSYYASGIKVDQEATWVGLGWSLNAGGVITRQTVGRPDCYNNAGVFNRTSFPEYDGGTTIPAYVNQIHDDLQAGADNWSDNGHDIFYFNFNGKSGRFFLDNLGNGVFSKYEDVKVKFIHNPANYERPHFTVTDERGVIYEFHDFETTQPPGQQAYISAWYLSKITSPSGGEITFEYKPGGMIHRHFQKRAYDEAWIPLQYSANNLPAKYVMPAFDKIGNINGLVPKKMTSSSGNYVEFITSPNARQDSENLTANQLDYLVAYNYKGELIRKFKFNYSYFEANNSDKFSDLTLVADFLNYRLRLDSLQEVSNAGQLQSPYRFYYHGDNNPLTDDPYTLPYRLSPSQDHWGYYNNTNNQTIFPSNPADRPFHVDYWFSQFLWGEMPAFNGFTYSIPNGGSRQPDTGAVKAATLKKITYPTGGYTSFEFESHDISSENLLSIFGGLRIKRIESHSGQGDPKIVNYDYLQYQSNEKCLDNYNPYYTWYYHNYDPDLEDAGNPELLAAFGVPLDVSMYNNLIARADGTPQITLGSGTNAVYIEVKESSPGNGYTIYHYNFTTDQEIAAYPDIDGVPVPGLFQSAYVTVYGSGSDIINVNSMPISSCSFPYPNFINNDWRRGHLVAKEVWSENETLLSQDSIYYDIRALQAAANYKVIRQDLGHYFYARSYIIGGLVKPVKDVRRIYQDDGSYLRFVKELEYNSTSHKQLTRSKEYSSKGDLVKTEYYYPTEYGSTFASLKSKNILTPIDTRTYRGSRLIAGTQIEYNDFGQPLKIRKAETSTTDIPFNQVTPYTFTEESVIGYNSNHLIEEVKDKSGVSKKYVWGYNQSYPIAEVVNASPGAVAYTSFEGNDHGGWSLNPGGTLLTNNIITGGKTYSGGINKTVPKGDYIVTAWAAANITVNSTAGVTPAITSKRDAGWRMYQWKLNNVTSIQIWADNMDEVRLYPAGAQMTTYTYDPLIGMTSQCDVNNRITYYGYDAFNRLNLVRDQDWNIIKRVCYNFHGEPESCLINP